MGNINYPDKSFFCDYSNKMKCLTFPIMTQVINKYSKDGMITLQNFNEIISVLCHDESFPKLAYTHLSEKLYGLLDQDKKGLIDNDTFMKGFCMVLSSTEACLHSIYKYLYSNLHYY